MEQNGKGLIIMDLNSIVFQHVNDTYMYILSWFVFQPCLTKSWEMHVHFKVHGQGSDLFGDGFAIWYTKEKLQEGELFEVAINFK